MVERPSAEGDGVAISFSQKSQPVPTLQVSRGSTISRSSGNAGPHDHIRNLKKKSTVIHIRLAYIFL